jgi:hypothetical protein
MNEVMIDASGDCDFTQLEQVLYMWAQATLAEKEINTVLIAVNDDYFEKEVA